MTLSFLVRIKARESLRNVRRNYVLHESCVLKCPKFTMSDSSNQWQFANAEKFLTMNDGLIFNLILASLLSLMMLHRKNCGETNQGQRQVQRN